MLAQLLCARYINMVHEKPCNHRCYLPVDLPVTKQLDNHLHTPFYGRVLALLIHHRIYIIYTLLLRTATVMDIATTVNFISAITPVCSSAIAVAISTEIIVTIEAQSVSNPDVSGIGVGCLNPCI